eukprot:6074017-Karenia_brevis.AAC.1
MVPAGFCQPISHLVPGTFKRYVGVIVTSMSFDMLYVDIMLSGHTSIKVKDEVCKSVIPIAA